MFSDPVSFNGATRYEVITVLANCGMDTDRARRALVTWIRHKQTKGRSTEHILAKLRDIESKFIKDYSLHNVFRDARAETYLPRPSDLPLPAHLRRASDGRIPESAPPVMTTIPITAGPSTTSPSSTKHPAVWSKQAGSSAPPLRLSQSSQTLEISPGNSSLARRVSLPQNIPRIPQSGSPRIKIPRHQSVQPSADSPITSSPEESGLHSRYRFMPDPAESSLHYYGLPTPPSASPPEFLSSAFSSQRQNYRSSRRQWTNSIGTSSSEDSVFHPKYRQVSKSSSLRRVTPPRTCPPDVPLPPIPQDMYLDYSMPKDVLPTEQPSTPLHSSSQYVSTPARPLPMQPIPSPVPSPDEADQMSTIDGDSTPQYWVDSNSESLPSDDVVRQDSPVFMLHGDHTISTATSAPPPYVDQLDAHFPLEMPTLSESLNKAVNVCSGSPEVRLEVTKCVRFERGYEPPYWQGRLSAAGLNAEAVKYLVDEMSKQVDWATSFGRAV